MFTQTPYILIKYQASSLYVKALVENVMYSLGLFYLLTLETDTFQILHINYYVGKYIL